MGNVFGRRKDADALVQPWIADVAVGKGIFDYYDSLGSVTYTTDMSFQSILDGPMVVKKFQDLTINAAANNVTLTTTNRCRGLMLLVEGNLTMQRTSSFVPRISMTARGAKGRSDMGLYDFVIPNTIQLSGKGWSKKQALDMIRAQGFAICDRWLWDEWGKISGVSAVAWTGGTVLLTASGCGIGGVGPATGNVVGNAGYNGTNGGTGGGGSGGVGGAGAAWSGSKGRPWGGGIASSGHNLSGLSMPADMPDSFGGVCPPAVATSVVCGGGAGNPGGAGVNGGAPGLDGTGGILIIVVKGTITLNTGAVVDADGMNGGNGSTNGGAGGGSGGGHVSIIANTAGGLNPSFTGDSAPAGEAWNNGTIRASGGSAGTATYVGGAGGSGSVVTKTFAMMGW